MSRVTALTHTLIGKKVVMATSGVVLLGFVLVHMVGNLKVFLGAEHFDAYAEWLRTVGAPLFGRGQLLWIARSILLLAVALHIAAAWAVTRASWAARPVGYHDLQLVHTTYAARTVRWGAVIILLFVIFHLLDLTFGQVNPSFVPGDPYHNVVATFSRVPVSLGYIVAMGALCLHLYHGIESGCQTLGLNHPRYNAWRRRIALAFSLVVSAGYSAVPVAVLAGALR
jgi:succinate dehydrogenase / fumarate reductase cytochrome b subunit